MPLPPNPWWPGYTIYTGAEYKEVLRKRYGLPDDWEPTAPDGRSYDEIHGLAPVEEQPLGAGGLRSGRSDGD
jgi:hypothetical protein